MLTLFFTVALVHIVALMSPGPDFFFVSQTAVSRSRKEAMMGVLGITCGVMVWAGVALLGLHLIIEKMAWLHTIIMVGGGLYLCWIVARRFFLHKNAINFALSEGAKKTHSAQCKNERKECLLMLLLSRITFVESRQADSIFESYITM